MDTIIESKRPKKVIGLDWLKIQKIYISPGHNFFGHFGQPAGANLALAVDEVECVAGLGLRGDRFFGYKENYLGQVTFFASEVYHDMCEHLNVHNREASVLRRNVLISGIDLNTLIGDEFIIQGIRFAGMAECSPCFWMDEVFGPGAEKFLRGRGGLRARILSSGLLRTSS